jgi:glycosyltransferase involved in cell wall biosynthesis
MIRGATAVVAGYLRRCIDLARLARYDIVWIHREATPFGPPIVEWMVRHILRKPIVYDFDDAIWMADGNENVLARLARCRWKVRLICRWAAHVTAGNAYLKAYAGQFNSNVSVVPTSVDVVARFNAVRVHRNGARVVLGWTGSRSTNRYLDMIGAVLRQLRAEREFDVTVISDRRPEFGYPDARFVQWHADAEIEQLLDLDIGLMPLDDTPWTRGKCGFKLIQYMALGIPPVASAVGANLDIVRHGVDGFLCSTPDDWLESLRRLIDDVRLRQEMGTRARARIEQSYSAGIQAETLAAVFAGSAGRTAAPGIASTAGVQ